MDKFTSSPGRTISLQISLDTVTWSVPSSQVILSCYGRY